MTGGPERLEELCRLADAGNQGKDLLPEAAANLPLDDPLNDYVEAHVHGGLVIARDVEALELDPADRRAYAKALVHFGCPVEEHPGYSAAADAIDPGYRGPVPVRLARQLGGVITPVRLAAASRTGNHDPQAIKWLWHCLARFGRQT